MSAVPGRLSQFLVIAVLAICIYRARTQSLTVDEAWVFNSFVNQELAEMARHYDACNHILHTLLMKVSRHYLGTGELALRVPGLLGALLYCLAVYKLSRLTLQGWVQPLAVALLTLHPMILDFLIAARGYGLALAFLMWSCYCVLLYFLRGLAPKWLRLAGVLSGLSVAANLVMLFPAAAIGFVLLILALRNGFRSLWQVVDTYGGPALVTAFLIVIIPILPATPENFYYGETSVVGSLYSLVSPVVKVHRRWPGPSADSWTPAAAIVVCLFLSALAIGFVRLMVRYLRSSALLYRLIPTLLFAGTLVASISFILIAGAIFGVKYPMGRTGLYLIPLFFLAALTSLRHVQSHRWKWVRSAGYGAGAFVVLVSVIQTDNRVFAEWAWDAGTGRLLRSLHEDVARRGAFRDEPALLGTSMFIEQTAKYYRVRRKLDWLAEPERFKSTTKAYDYYLLTHDDADVVDKLHLVVIAKDRVSGEMLARRDR